MHSDDGVVPGELLVRLVSLADHRASDQLVDEERSYLIEM